MLSDTTQEVFGSWLSVWRPYVIRCSLGCNFFLSVSAAHSVIYTYYKDFPSLSLFGQIFFLECWAGSRLSGVYTPLPVESVYIPHSLWLSMPDIWGPGLPWFPLQSRDSLHCSRWTGAPENAPPPLRALFVTISKACVWETLSCASCFLPRISFSPFSSLSPDAHWSSQGLGFTMSFKGTV